MSDVNGLKVGDVVRLASGGPLMVVDAFIGDGDETKAHCTWFSPTAALQFTNNEILPMFDALPSNYYFLVASLRRVPEDQPKG